MIHELTKKLRKGLGIKLKPVKPADIDKNPKASFHFAKGLGLYFSGNYDAAIVQFMKTQDLMSKSDRPGYWMAMCFMKTGEYRHALIELEKLASRFSQAYQQGKVKEMTIECKRHLGSQATSKPAMSKSKNLKRDNAEEKWDL